MSSSGTTSVEHKMATNYFMREEAVQHPPSLLQVMDEEFALKLQEEEEEKARGEQVPSVVKEEEEEEFDEQLKLALKISEAEAKGEQQHSAIDDLELAKRLQEQYDMESFGSVLSEEKKSVPLQEYDGMDSDEEEEGEEGEGMDEAMIVKEKRVSNAPIIRGKKEIITKHDPLVSATKNAERLEKLNYAGDMKDVKLGSGVYHSLVQTSRKQQGHSNRVRNNKLDKTTHEQVLDQTTRAQLLKLINSELLSEVNGIVSTGKEANVYHAVGAGEGEGEGEGEGKEFAVKIYKTTLNEFKHRSEYHGGTQMHNTRKVIKAWAEKEAKNLKTLSENGVPCPTPILLRNNILIMTFIGKQGWPAPALRDTDLTEEKLIKCYLQTVKWMRTMYQKCHLIHADLSEYNILYFKSKVWIIDVSQSVDWDHEKALEYLQRDCNAITNFFSRKGVNCLSKKQLQNFITDMDIEDEDQYLESLEPAQ